MKILLVTKKFPYPLKEGEPIAINYLARSLTALGCVVDLLVLNTSKHFFDPKDFPASENFFREVHSVPVQNHITVFGALKSLLLGQAYILDRYKSFDFADKLSTLLAKNQYNVVQMETIYLAAYGGVVANCSKAKLVLRAHNVEHEIWERVATTTSNPLKKWYLRNQNKHLRRFEKSHLNHFDALLAITARDLDAFRKLGFKKEGLVVPVGINLSEYPTDNQQIEHPLSACFIGALDWMPNQHGVVWFVEEVWKKVAIIYPKASFHVAGKNTPDWLRSKIGSTVQVHGEVPDAKAFIQKYPILVAPLFSGSGIKIKVLEGMALGRTVITTTIGAEGIPAENGRHLLIADTPAAFVEKLQWCFENPGSALEIGKNGRQFIQHFFDNLEIANEVKGFYQNLINN